MFASARIAGHRLAWCLRKLKAGGVTAPWGRYYLLPEYFDDEMMHCHERVHLKQMRKDGTLWFLVKWCWWCLRYGYAANPYEVEARQKAEFGVTTEDVIRRGLKRPAWMPAPQTET